MTTIVHVYQLKHTSLSASVFDPATPLATSTFSQGHLTEVS